MGKPDTFKGNPIPSLNNDDGRKYGFGDLPEHIQHKILTCLPLKSVFVFKSVTKRWNSFISTQYFSISYMAANQCHSPNRTLLLLRNNDGPPVSSYPTLGQRLLWSSINDNIEKPFTVPDFPFPTLKRKVLIGCEPHVVVSACNGLLLCRTGGPLYGICNPITRQWVVLPRHNVHYYNHHTRISFVAKVDKSSSKLISFRVVFLKLPSLWLSELRMVIYDSDMKKWIKSNVKLPGRDFFISVVPMQNACLDGIIYWEFERGEVHYAAAVDPYKHGKDQCRLMVLPTASIFSSKTTWDTLLGVCNGKLHYLKTHLTGHDVAIWVLEDYGNEIWELKHMLTGINLNYSDGRDLHGLCRPLAFHPMDSNIIYICCTTDDKTLGDTIVIALDIEKKTLSPVSSTRVKGYSSVFPFVLPLWPLAFDTTTNLCIA